MMEEYDEDSVGEELDEFVENRATNDQVIKTNVANKQTERNRQEVEELRRRQDSAARCAMHQCQLATMGYQKICHHGISRQKTIRVVKAKFVPPADLA
mgnify:CR=1 FL=1